MKNITAVDLNLLVAFDALFEERSVTNAANRIGLAQPSMSNALSRLRALFNDELFIRTSGGMVPTPLAEQISVLVQNALSQAQSAINIGQEFDPKTTTADISILVNDYVEQVFVPPILKALNKEAPNIRVVTRPVTPERYGPPLERGQVDFAIAAFPKPTSSMNHIELVKDFPVCIAREHHPSFFNGIDLESYLSCKHVSVSQTGESRGRIDDVLEKMGRNRELSVTISNFATLPNLISETDLVAVVPNSFATKIQKTIPVIVHSLPFDMPAFTLNLIWGRVVDQSALHMWFRDTVIKALSDK